MQWKFLYLTLLSSFQNVSIEMLLAASLIIVFSMRCHLFVSAAYDEINIVFFFGSNLSVFQNFSLTSIDQIPGHKAFKKNLTTALYIHGYRENVTSESVETIVKAFLKRQTHNMLVLDWSIYSGGNYVTNAVPNLIQVWWE